MLNVPDVRSIDVSVGISKAGELGYPTLIFQDGVSNATNIVIEDVDETESGSSNHRRDSTFFHNLFVDMTGSVLFVQILLYLPKIDKNFNTDWRLQNGLWKQFVPLLNPSYFLGEEIAVWIDMRARWVFPVAFLLFNIGYWIFAFRADCALGAKCEQYDAPTL